LNHQSEIHDAFSSVWYIDHHISERLHPTQMPIKVAERILNLATKEGDQVLDSFMGSGTTGVICKQLKRDFIGIEIDENYYNIAEKRIGHN
jgi:site-specific DNA-methyltransferase (adenine-specific)